ncbi:MAG: 4-hydroxythreonine-4-phosphate dehydrogenase PdxA, partial [Cyanobacteria bacterium RUI128]|nr:4-hydroxythreonine-4-phosphate dehydrogenase PdxA [Cyanobacteria bacterium RUI128]
MNQKYKDKIAVTTGDINGIGAEITVKALKSLDVPPEKVVIISSKDYIDKYPEFDSKYEVLDIPFVGNVEYGKLSKESGEFSFQCLKKACEIQPKAIVTAPVSKEALHLAGHNFNGQTEVLEHFLAHDGQKAEMLFTSSSFDVLLLTRHCALKEVQITQELIIEKVNRLADYYSRKGVEKPKFALCSLNPHAGEGGILGREEIEVIKPAVNILRESGVNITDPLPSDTLFVDAGKSYYKGEKAPYSCYIAMYHDQGLIPIKTIAAEKTVNTTIGLDIIRTSPSHGTAFD